MCACGVTVCVCTRGNEGGCVLAGMCDSRCKVAGWAGVERPTFAVHEKHAGEAGSGGRGGKEGRAERERDGGGE